MRATNIRWWLKRDDCPEVIRQFKVVFDRAFSRKARPVGDDWRERLGEVANVVRDGVHYSRAITHLGNSLILYYPSQSACVPVVGSIQKITANGCDAWMTVKRYTPLPPGVHDPFKRYPSFPACLYSSTMLPDEDHIPINSILCHVARFNLSSDRVVILNLSRVSSISQNSRI